MTVSNFQSVPPAVTDVYTDLNGLQQLRAHENKDEAIKKVAQQFESLFVNMMMKSMRDANAVFEKDSLFSSQESQFFRDMHDQQLSLTVAHGKGVGIADALYRQMTRDRSPAQPDIEDLSALRKNPELYSLARARIESLSSNQTIADSVQRQEVTTSSEAQKHNPSESTPSRVSIADSANDFVKQLLPLAQKAANKLGVEPEVLVAQAALETGWGQFVLANKQGESSNNVFNIKSGSGWNGDSVNHATLEFTDNIFQTEQANFRSYTSLGDSFNDYVDFIRQNDRYEDAVTLAPDAEKYIEALQNAGYATDPEYADKVKSVYQRIVQADLTGSRS